MRIAPVTNSYLQFSFKSETIIGPDYPIHPKTSTQTDAFDEDDEFFIIKPSEDDIDDDAFIPYVNTDTFVKGLEF